MYLDYRSMKVIFSEIQLGSIIRSRPFKKIFPWNIVDCDVKPPINQPNKKAFDEKVVDVRMLVYEYYCVVEVQSQVRNTYEIVYIYKYFLIKIKHIDIEM